MVPDALAARLNGLGLVPVSEQFGEPAFHVPVFCPGTALSAGGLGLAMIPFCVALEILRTVITTRKLLPDTIALAGVPEVSVV